MKRVPFLLLLSSALCGCQLTGVEHVPPTKGGEYCEEEVLVPDSALGDVGVGTEAMDMVAEVSGPSPLPPSLPKVRRLTNFHKPIVIKRRTFKQGENPSSDSKLHMLPSGELSVTTGESKPNSVVTLPQADYTKYYALVAGFIMIGWGIYSMSIGWERIGTRFIIYGSAAVIIALTVEKNGPLYSLALTALALYVAYEKYKAYKKGEQRNLPNAS